MTLTRLFGMGDLAIKRTRNALYQTAYHAVWIPKYHRRVLVGEIVDRLRGVLHAVCQAKGFEVLALEIQPGSAETIRRYIERTEHIESRR